MDESGSYFSLYGKPPMLQLAYSLLIILIAGGILFAIMVLSGRVIFTEDYEVFLKSYSGAGGKESVSFLRYLVISQDISFFIVPGIFIYYLLEPAGKATFRTVNSPGTKEVALVVVLAFCLFPLTSFAGQLNSSVHLPDWLSGTEKWMERKENNASHITDLLMSSGSLGVMLLNILIMALIPAVGEELIFRGVLQGILCKLLKSGHTAIWITAIFFSAIHLQFFGFIPRLILGLVFGYLFYWSGMLWLPVIAHFVNNAVPVIWSYLSGCKNIHGSDNVSSANQISGLLFPLALGTIILIYFRNRSKRVTDKSF
jgi:uncharacterized protein